MKRITSFLFTLVAVLGFGVLAQASTINVNITSGAGGNPGAALNGTDQTGFTPVDPAGTVWNDLGGNITSTDLVDSLNGSTGIGVSQTSNGGNAQAGFTFSQAPGLNAAGADIIDNYLAATNGFGPALAGAVEFTFTGLDPALQYVFHVVATGDGSFQGATLGLEGQSLTTAGVNAATDNNVLTEGVNFVSFDPIQSASGTAVLSLAAGPGNVSFAAISGFQIEVVPEPASAGLVAIGLATGFLRRRR